MFSKILTYCFLLLSGLQTFAQTDPTPVRDLDLKIMPPIVDESLQFDPGLSFQLKRKVTGVFTRYGVVDKSTSTFALYPRLYVLEFGQLEGIAVSQTVSLELSFLVKNIFSGQDFSVFSRKLSGAGKTKREALKNALSSIRPQQKVYANYIDQLQEKIDHYFDVNCNEIVTEANTAIENNEYEKAITLLYTLPVDSGCRKEHANLLNQTYLSYQSQNCQTLIQKAEVAVLKKDYKDAINLLGEVDPQSPCREQSQELLNEVSEKVDEQTAKKMAFLNKVYQDNVEIEKVRQESMKSISNTYIEGIKKD